MTPDVTKNWDKQIKIFLLNFLLVVQNTSFSPRYRQSEHAVKEPPEVAGLKSHPSAAGPHGFARDEMANMEGKASTGAVHEKC